MHELGITQEILNAAIKAAEEADGVAINDVAISVGEMTEVVEFALQFNWEVVRQDTIASDATLTVTMIPPKSVCKACGVEFSHDKWDMTCPECGALLCEMIEGRELRIDTIDITTPEDLEKGTSGTVLGAD